MKRPSIRTIAVFSVSAGTGHIRAAEALKATAQERFPDVSVAHIDLMTLVPPLFRRVYADSYVPLVEHHPALWGYLYQQADRRKLDSGLDRLRIAIERLNTQKLRSTLEQINPDCVICTHFLPAELFSRWRRKGSFQKPVWVVVTDFDVHMLWVHRHLTGYCTASAEVAHRLSDRGVPAADIHVTGIPIMPAFTRRLSRMECARELGLNPAKPTLLLMSGGTGFGSTHKLALRLLETLGRELQLIALAGKNVKLLASLRELAAGHPGRLVAMGYTESVERVMAASDLAITKSGGLTTSECLAMGLPLVVVSPIPGQEERNADYLLEHGAALKAYDAGGVEFRVQSLLEDRARLNTMRGNALRLGRPQAAEDILRLALRRQKPLQVI